MGRDERRRERRAARQRAREAAGSRRKARAPLELPVPVHADWRWSRAHLEVLHLARTVLTLVRNPRSRGGDPFAQTNPEWRYGLLFAACAIGIGGLGMLIFFAGGARRYFNPWFLFTMPIIAVVAGVLPGVLLAAVARLAYRRESDRRHGQALLSAFFLPLVLSTPLWCLQWVRLWFPGFTQAFFWFALPGLAFGMLFSVPWAQRHFPARIWMPLLLGAWGLFAYGLYLIPATAAALIRLLRL